MTREEENQIIGEAVRRLPEVMTFRRTSTGWFVGHPMFGYRADTLIELAQAILADQERFPVVEEPK